jgi:plasmid stabilization system protein ParE
MTAIIWTEPAREHLLSIKSPKLIDKVLQAVGGLSTFPRKGQVVPEAQDDPTLEEIRQLVIPGKCRVIYQYIENLELVAVLGIQFRGQHLTPETLRRYLSGQ